MNDRDSRLLQELEAGRETIAAVEPPRGAWRESLRTSFVTGDPIERVDSTADDDGAELLADCENRVPGPSSDYRSALRAKFAAQVEQTEPIEQSGESVQLVPGPSRSEDVNDGLRLVTEPRPRQFPKVAGLAFAAAAAVALVFVGRLLLTKDVPAEESRWTLVEATSPESLRIKPTAEGDSAGDLETRLREAEMVEVGDSMITLTSSAGIDLVLREDGILEGRPFMTFPDVAASTVGGGEGPNPSEFVLSNGMLMLRQSGQVLSPLVIATLYGDITVSGTTAITAEDVGLVLAVARGTATFTPYPKPTDTEASQPGKDGGEAKPKEYVLSENQLLVIPYPNMDPIVDGFDSKMCTETEALVIFIKELQEFDRTGRV